MNGIVLGGGMGLIGKLMMGRLIAGIPMMGGLRIPVAGGLFGEASQSHPIAVVASRSSTATNTVVFFIFY